MARVIIDDRWLKTADDGTPPSTTARRALANARDPQKARVPDKWKTTRYGTGKRWRCRWYMPVDGHVVQKSKMFTKYKQAEEFKAAMEDDARRGRYHDPHQANRRFRDVADEWLQSKLDLKSSTRSRYERELRVYINPQWGDTPLRAINRTDIQKWVEGLSTGDYPAHLPAGRTPRPLRPRSIRNIVRVVMGGVLDYATSQQWISSNPMQGVVTPKIIDNNDDRVYLTIREVELLADECETVSGRHVDATLVRFLAYTGLRVNEALALRISDVDWAHSRVRVARTWTDDGQGGQKLDVPKNGKPRWAAMPSLLVAPLRELAGGQSEDAWLFRAPRGGSIWLHNWRARVWNPAVRNAGMEDEGVTIHSLRHTYASIAIAAGADVKTLQSQLGHSSATITLDTYAALWPERLGEVADAVGGMVSDTIMDTLGHD